MEGFKAKKKCPVLPLVAEVRETKDIHEAMRLMSDEGMVMIAAAQGGNGEMLYCLARCDMGRAARSTAQGRQTGAQGSKEISGRDPRPGRRLPREAPTHQRDAD